MLGRGKDSFTCLTFYTNSAFVKIITTKKNPPEETNQNKIYCEIQYTIFTTLADNRRFELSNFVDLTK